MDEALSLLNSLAKEASDHNDVAVAQVTAKVSAVLCSVLLSRCYDVLKTLESSALLDELNAILLKASVQPNLKGLPPLSNESIRFRVERIAPKDAKEMYFIEMPDVNPERPLKRCGLILRQHLLDGEVTKLFVAGVEKDSPASR
ncbi:hypothetical protein EG68_01782 [Paragonimus skrjabini miyazakii]|uniref:Uncharacterized protein n=1 Tax=Paragonimus skrjabini miyazakii TaxID=59628 RepID=A0A8S9Z2F1_9TREM|nr:hypothetical protein EG68_01782 [Paragonimus skrjabini miyazakii]